MKIKLLLDEDTQFSIAKAFRNRGFDVIHAQETGGKGLTDKEQLEYAIKTDRILFTYNVKDYVLLHNEYIKSGLPHCGIIVSRQLPLKIIINKLLITLQKASPETLKNNIEFL